MFIKSEQKPSEDSHDDGWITSDPELFGQTCTEKRNISSDLPPVHILHVSTETRKHLTHQLCFMHESAGLIANMNFSGKSFGSVVCSRSASELSVAVRSLTERNKTLTSADSSWMKKSID